MQALTTAPSLPHRYDGSRPTVSLDQHASAHYGALTSPQVRWLKANDAYARAVAMAGRARMAALTTDAVADYVAELLKQCADDPR